MYWGWGARCVPTALSLSQRATSPPRGGTGRGVPAPSTPAGTASASPSSRYGHGTGTPPSCPVPWWGPHGVLPIALTGGLSIAVHRRSATGCPTAGTGTRPRAGCPRMRGTAGTGGPGHPGVPAAAPAAPASSCVRGAAASRAPMCCTSATARPRRHGPASAPPAPVSGQGAARGAGGLGGPCGWGAWGIWGFPWLGMPRGSGGSRVHGCWGHPGGSQCTGDLRGSPSQSCPRDWGGSHSQHCLGGGFPWLQLPKGPGGPHDLGCPGDLGAAWCAQRGSHSQICLGGGCGGGVLNLGLPGGGTPALTPPSAHSGRRLERVGDLVQLHGGLRGGGGAPAALPAPPGRGPALRRAARHGPRHPGDRWVTPP